jgi:hypothetical protein
VDLTSKVTSIEKQSVHHCTRFVSTQKFVTQLPPCLNHQVKYVRSWMANGNSLFATTSLHMTAVEGVVQ